MIKTEVHTNGNMLTNIVTTDDEDQYGSSEVEQLEQRVEFKGWSKQYDDRFIAHIGGAALVSQPQMELGPIQMSRFELDMDMSETSVEVNAYIDGSKAYLKMSTDKETFSSLTKSKVLRLVTEDGKEVVIEMKIEQD